MSSPLNSTSGGTATEQSYNPAQSLAEQEQKLQRKYGNNFPVKKGLLGQKVKDRKWFDSGDYALSQAGKTNGPVGSQHPQPENIPHSNPAQSIHNVHGSPPVKESSLMHQAESAPESNHHTIAQPNV
ncbi:hypothetical protein BGZ76_005599 [Entomortierella beljakovae]|nr:hypothetical protein BGZ76_005599 [Entomortierella beljakovae]